MHPIKVGEPGELQSCLTGNSSLHAKLDHLVHGTSFALVSSVRATKRPWFRLSLIVAVFVAAVLMASILTGVTIQSIGQSPGRPRITPVTDPSATPRLSAADIVYVGGFRLPAEEVDGASFSFGGSPLAYNPANDSLFVGARGSSIAEVTIPSPVNSTRVEELPFARFLQPFRDPTEGRLRDVANEGVYVGGLLVHDGLLYGSGVIYYDANHAQELTHFSRSLTLTDPSVKGMYRVGDKGKAGLVAGYLAAVPPEWQSALGGPALTGQCCIPIVSRTSWGPAAFAWNPADLRTGQAARVSPLVYYTGEHATLGPWEGSNETYGGATEMGGLVIPPRTRTALFVGRNGIGPFCYGGGTADQSLANQSSSSGERLCYDPTSSDKGSHTYPYRYQFWAYDLSDLAAVRAGKKDPWEVRPYGVWPFDVPTPQPGKRIGGVGFDAARRLLYVAQMSADQDGYAYRPIIHVFRIQ